MSLIINLIELNLFRDRLWEIKLKFHLILMLSAIVLRISMSSKLSKWRVQRTRNAKGLYWLSTGQKLGILPLIRDKR